APVPRQEPPAAMDLRPEGVIPPAAIVAMHVCLVTPPPRVIRLLKGQIAQGGIGIPQSLQLLRGQIKRALPGDERTFDERDGLRGALGERGNAVYRIIFGVVLCPQSPAL